MQGVESRSEKKNIGLDEATMMKMRLIRLKTMKE